MTDATPAGTALGAECRAFARYLAGQDPSAYVLAWYQRIAASAADEAPPVLIDRVSLALARRGSLPARCADAYARVFRPYGLLRRRLVLLLAILENSPPSSAWLNAARTGGPSGVIAGMAGSLLAGGAALLVGCLVLGPVHLAGRLGGSAR
jgi:hypothetical protein